MTKLDTLYTMYSRTTLKVKQEINWNADSDWAEYVKEKLESLEFKWSETAKNYFIFFKIEEDIKTPGLAQFTSKYFGNTIVFKLSTDHGYCYLPELWSNISDDAENSEFIHDQDWYQNKPQFDKELQKVHELLTSASGEIKNQLLSLKINSPTAI